MRRTVWGAPQTCQTKVSPGSWITNAPRGSKPVPRTSATALGTRYRAAPALCAASRNSRHGAGGLLRRFCQLMSCRRTSVITGEAAKPGVMSCAAGRTICIV